jgi:hypothetical protein
MSFGGTPFRRAAARRVWAVYRPHGRSLSTMYLTVFYQPVTDCFAARPTGPTGAVLPHQFPHDGRSRSVGWSGARRTLATIFRRSWHVGDTPDAPVRLRFTIDAKAGCLGRLRSRTDQSGTVTCRIVDVNGSSDRGGLGRRFTRGPHEGRGRAIGPREGARLT